jgi:hypothetical protein
MQALHKLEVLDCEEVPYKEEKHRWHYSLADGIKPDVLMPESSPDLAQGAGAGDGVLRLTTLICAMCMGPNLVKIRDRQKRSPRLLAAAAGRTAPTQTAGRSARAFSPASPTKLRSNPRDPAM